MDQQTIVASPVELKTPESCILRKIFNTTHTYCVYMQIYLEAKRLVQLTFLWGHSVWLQLPPAIHHQSPQVHTARELMMVLWALDSGIPSVPPQHRSLYCLPPDDTVACSCRDDEEICFWALVVEKEWLDDTTEHGVLGLLVVLKESSTGKRS